MTKYHLQNTKQKTKDSATRIPVETGFDSAAPERYIGSNTGRGAR
jgi:hypothetical protein